MLLGQRLQAMRKEQGAHGEVDIVASMAAAEQERDAAAREGESDEE